MRLTASPAAHDITYSGDGIALLTRERRRRTSSCRLADGRVLFADSDARRPGLPASGGAGSFVGDGGACSAVPSPRAGCRWRCSGDGRVVRRGGAWARVSGRRPSTRPGSCPDVVSAGRRPELAGATIVPRTIVVGRRTGWWSRAAAGPPENRNGVALAPPAARTGHRGWSTGRHGRWASTAERGGRAGRCRSPSLTWNVGLLRYTLDAASGHPIRRALGIGGRWTTTPTGVAVLGGRARARGGDAGRAVRVPHRAATSSATRPRARSIRSFSGRRALPASGAGLRCGACLAANGLTRAARTARS